MNFKGVGYIKSKTVGQVGGPGRLERRWSGFNWIGGGERIGPLSFWRIRSTVRKWSCGTMEAKMRLGNERKKKNSTYSSLNVDKMR